MQEQDAAEETADEGLPSATGTDGAPAGFGFAHAAGRWLRRLLSVFLNPRQRRLRALWRLVLHALALGAAMFAVGVAVVFAVRFLDRVAPLAGSRLARLRQPTEARLVLLTLVQGVLATGVTGLACRFLDRRKLAGLGLQRTRHRARDLAFGFVLAGAMLALVFLTMLACGWLRLRAVAWESASPGTILASLAGAALTFVAVGWYEELISRGYWIVNLREGLNLPLAVLVSSSVFALGHASNPNATAVSTLALFGAGLFLALPVVRTGQLWMSIGIHIGWNFFEGPVFGFAVSGIRTFQLLRHEVSGPTTLTGGDFGPEAGLLLLAAQVLGAVLVWSVTRGRAAEPA